MSTANAPNETRRPDRNYAPGNAILALANSTTVVEAQKSRAVPTQTGAAPGRSPPEDDWRTIAAALKLRGRSLQVVRCVVTDDMKEAAIAAQLEISRHTVHTIVQRLYRRLNVRSRLQLAQLCERCRRSE